MNIDHHPSEALLLDYASGALGEGWSVAIATHLALCPTCRQVVQDMEAIGAALMESLKPAPLSENLKPVISTASLVARDEDETAWEFPPSVMLFEVLADVGEAHRRGSSF